MMVMISGCQCDCCDNLTHHECCPSGSVHGVVGCNKSLSHLIQLMCYYLTVCLFYLMIKSCYSNVGCSFIDPFLRYGSVEIRVMGNGNGKKFWDVFVSPLFSLNLLQSTQAVF